MNDAAFAAAPVAGAADAAAGAVLRRADLEFEAIKRAQRAGHLFVASAGNHNLNTDLAQ